MLQNLTSFMFIFSGYFYSHRIYWAHVLPGFIFFLWIRHRGREVDFT